MRYFARQNRDADVEGSRAQKPVSEVKAERRALFVRFAKTRDPAIREQLVFAYLALVRHIAYRFAKRQHPLEDLVQVGTIGLIGAIDRFDPERGCDFSSYAVPTIVGEIKRYFRDKSWAMRVPRRSKDLNVKVDRAIDEMTVELGRPVTYTEVAERLCVDVDEIIEAQETGRAYSLRSLDSAVAAGDGPTSRSIGASLGVTDEGIESLIDRSSLKVACKDLDRRERAIVYLRFFQNLPQAEIGRRLGCTQMHVSRLQQRAIEKMRRAWAAT
jgi:RNA polymerase sigma-B factor